MASSPCVPSIASPRPAPAGRRAAAASASRSSPRSPLPTGAARARAKARAARSRSCSPRSVSFTSGSQPTLPRREPSRLGQPLAAAVRQPRHRRAAVADGRPSPAAPWPVHGLRQLQPRALRRPDRHHPRAPRRGRRVRAVRDALGGPASLGALRQRRPRLLLLRARARTRQRAAARRSLAGHRPRRAHPDRAVPRGPPGPVSPDRSPARDARRGRHRRGGDPRGDRTTPGGRGRRGHRRGDRLRARGHPRERPLPAACRQPGARTGDRGGMTSPTLTALEGLRFISLAEVEHAVPLRVRTDNKHLVNVAVLDELLERLEPTHRALEIEGRRAFAYDTVYFDTDELLTARAHVQRRRHRFKCRSRLYTDTSACAFELKVKGARGTTIKHRIPYQPALHGTVTRDARAFLAEHLAQVPELHAVLRTTYTRITLAAPDERMTIDLGLSYGD